MSIHYLEIVSVDADAVVRLYEQALGITFGPPDADLGQARVATADDGSRLGVRPPLAEHEKPGIVRTYIAVDDIDQAVKDAQANGAKLAYGPTRQGARGNFAILLVGELQHGFWQA